MTKKLLLGCFNVLVIPGRYTVSFSYFNITKIVIGSKPLSQSRALDLAQNDYCWEHSLLTSPTASAHVSQLEQHKMKHINLSMRRYLAHYTHMPMHAQQISPPYNLSINIDYRFYCCHQRCRYEAEEKRWRISIQMQWSRSVCEGEKKY